MDGSPEEDESRSAEEDESRTEEVGMKRLVFFSAAMHMADSLSIITERQSIVTVKLWNWIRAPALTIPAG